jgi:hypothetical protein
LRTFHTFFARKPATREAFHCKKFWTAPKLLYICRLNIYIIYRCGSDFWKQSTRLPNFDKTNKQKKYYSNGIQF